MAQRSSKYTVDDSFTPYKDVANAMGEQGYKMNTATARHIFYRALEKIALGIIEDTRPDLEDPKGTAKTIAKSIEFQHMIQDAITEMDANQKDQ